jgi:hypothetical protein
MRSQMRAMAALAGLIDEGEGRFVDERAVKAQRFAIIAAPPETSRVQRLGVRPVLGAASETAIDSGRRCLRTGADLLSQHDATTHRTGFRSASRRADGHVCRFLVAMRLRTADGDPRPFTSGGSRSHVAHDSPIAQLTHAPSRRDPGCSSGESRHPVHELNRALFTTSFT